MKLYQYFFSILFISILCADNQTAEDILLKTLHRMDGIDYQLKLDSKSSGKKKRNTIFRHLFIGLLRGSSSAKPD